MRWGNRFWSNASSKFLNFVGKVPDEKTGKVSTMEVVGNILGKSIFKIVLTICCSSLLDDARSIPSL